MRNMSKLFYLSAAIWALVLSAVNVYSQCGTAPDITATYCPGQGAKMLVNDPDANTKYKWLLSKTDENGNYGADGKGRNYFVTNTQTGPADFMYVREIGTSIGPGYTPNIGGTGIVNDGVNAYKMPFTTTRNFRINTVSVIVRLDKPTAKYGFNVRYVSGTDTTYSKWFTAAPGALTSLGSNFYKVDVPVDFIITKKGTGSLELISSKDPGGAYEAAEAFYWWGGTEYNGANYAGTDIRFTEPEKVISTVARTPMIMDWKITLQCDTATVKTRLADVCCTPVGNNITLTSSKPNPVNADFPVTLTVAGSDIKPNLWYYWYDSDGALISAASGQNKNTYLAPKKGQYSVRVVNLDTDRDNFGCYSNKSILLNLKNIFAPDDKTICIGDPLTLTATGAEGDYKWSSPDPFANAAIVKPDTQTTRVYLTKEGVFTFEVEGNVKLGNIAYDGKFENYDKTQNFKSPQTNLSFETTYGRASGDNGGYIKNNSEYRVDNVVYAWYTNGVKCPDPTYFQKKDPVTGDIVSRGNIFYADAHSSGTGAPYSAEYGSKGYLWQLSNQPVEPNTQYTFSMDISEWNGTEAPDIMLLVNGQPLTNLSIDGVPVTAKGAGYYTFDGPSCTWKTLTGIWNSGSNTSATITVSEVSQKRDGHEFAMDDITFFAGRGKQKDDVVITVKNCFELEARTDGTVCVGKPFALSLLKNNGFFSSWKNSRGEVVATTPTADVYPAADETYTATAKFPLINYLSNGNFEGDKLDFTHGFQGLNGSVIEAKQFIIGNGTETTLHTTVFEKNLGDHTTGTGKMMLARNASSTGTTVVMNQTIKVTAGQDYAFSAWLRNMHPNIYNGTLTNSGPFTFDLYLGAAKVASYTLEQVKDWKNFSYTWKAATSGNVNLELRVTSSHNESGFAIDDISVAQLGMEKSDDVKVTTSICNTLTLKDEGCKGNERLITYKTDAVFAGWYDPTGKFISTADTLKVIPGKKETYSAAASIALGDKNVNGNMEAGNLTGMSAPAGNDRTGSTQDLVYDTYAFVTNSNAWAKYPSVTAPGGTGKYLLVNSKAAANQTLYKSAPIAVKSGVTYNVSMNLAHVATPAILAYFTQLYPIKVMVGGVAVGEVTLPKNSTWQNINLPYTAAADGNVSIELVLVNKEGQSLTVDPWYLADKQYLAHGIDNVKLSETKKALSASIEVDPCVTCTPPKDLAVKTKGKDTVTSCEGTAVTLKGTMTGTASVAYRYTWYKTGGTAKATAAAYSDLAVTGAVADSGWYWLAVEDGTTGIAKCIAYDSVFVNIDGAVKPGEIADNQEICSGEKAKAFISKTKASGGDFTKYKYTWQYSDDNGTTWKAAGSTAETYTESAALTATRLYRRRAASGVCKDTVTAALTVKVNPVPTKPTITVDPAKTAFCAGELHTLTAKSTVASGTITYTWYGSATGTGDKVDGKTTTGSYTYKVTAKANNCNAPDTGKVTLTVNALPTAKFTGADTTICKGNNATLNVSLTGKAPWKVSYTGPEGAKTVTAASSPLAISTAADGTYTLTGVEDANGCTNTATGTKKVATTADLVIGTPVATCDFDTKKFTAVFDISGGDGNYKVDPAGTIVAGKYTSPAILSVDNSVHTFKVSDGSKCPANTNIPVEVKRDCSCPVVGKLTSTAMSICADSSFVNFEIELTGALTPPYYAEVKAPDNSIIRFDNLADGKNTLKITKLLTGAYTLSKVGDIDCDGGTAGSVNLTVNELPVAKISGGGTICKGNEADITFELTKGKAPWTINYTDPSGADKTISSSKVSDVLKTNTDGKYIITGVKDANQCSNTATGEVSVKTTPDLVVGAPVATCNFTTQKFDVVFDVSGGDGNYTVTGHNGGTVSAGKFTSNPVASNAPTDFLFKVSDGSNCPANTNVEVTGSKNCSCPVEGKLDATAQEICADKTDIELSLDLSGAIALPYAAEITAPDGTVIKFPGLVAGTNTLNITNLQDGIYKLTKAADATCPGSISGSVDLTINALPTAVISGDTAICDNAAASANIKVKLTGKAPFDLTVEGSTSGAKTINGVPLNSYTIPTVVTETYTITALKDANNCVATSMTGSAEVTHLENPEAADTNIICDPANPVNGAPGTYNYYIEVRLTGGNAATYKEITGKAGSFTGNVWKSAMIEESIVTDLMFTDKFSCKPVVISGLQKICSCPESANIAVDGPDKVCEQGSLLTTGLKITLNDGGNTVTDWKFSVHDASGAIVQGHDYRSVPYTGGTTLTISGVGKGEYYVKNVHGTCDGKGSGPAKVTYLESPAAEISGDATICDDGVTTTLVTIKPTKGLAPFTATYQVDGVNPTALPSGTLTYNTSDFGKHTLASVSDANGCTAKGADLKGSATIKGDQLPTTAAAGPDESICPDNYTLAANDTTAGIGIGKWLPVTGITIDNLNKHNAKISGIAEGQKVKLIWTIKNGVCPVSTDTVEIFRPGVTAPAAGPDDQICVGLDLNLAANTVKPTETGTWSITTGSANFTPDENQPSAVVSGLPVGVHKFVWTIENAIGCSKSDTMKAEVRTLPGAASIPDGDWVVCEGTKGENYKINPVTFADEYLWTISSGDAIIRPGNTVNAIVDFGSANSMITVTPSNDCGTGTPASVYVTISPDLKPSVSIGALKTLICEGDETTVFITDTANAGTPVYKWYVNGIPVQTNGDSLKYRFDRSAVVMVELYTSEACVDSTVLNNRGAAESVVLPVVAEEIPVADAGPDVYIMQGEIAHLVANGGVSYSWSPAVAVTDSITTRQFLNVSPDGPVQSYTVTAFSASKICWSHDEALVIVEKPVKPWNSFSPNGDGSYETWPIDNINEYPNASVEVYNRWGNLVWKSTGYSKGWDGTNFRNGEQLPVATYYYVIYPNGGKFKKPLTGDVTIVK
jgi:gliding motility-associated-like protein